jgi:hypothetical protein
MSGNIPLPNKVKTGEQRDRAQTIQQRIERGQEPQPRVSSIERMMKVKQPKQKANRCCTYRDNQRYRERNRRPLVGFRY